MTLRINSLAPDFCAESTQGEIQFHNWIGEGWAVLFSHPKDFTPVCTTELAAAAQMLPHFAARQCKLIGVSVDSLADHLLWKKDIEDIQNCVVDFPLIADENLAVAKLYQMLPECEDGLAGARKAADNATVRTVYIVGPDKKIKMMMTYPMTTGRNFNEILRALDSIQLTSRHQVATPVNWVLGDHVIIVPSVGDDEARQLFANEWIAVKPYLRLVPQPK
ncbi:peroxiredoxin [Iodobacter fluviatilis]|uniref:Thioredoxin peroxidase n=1 Tax=Iodobacter fluviatilis TaxID=537 RepID=A0A377Q619_9NEIS|nr:peroxiredoxin [Iodobacter fluviatilis]TCU80266.1 alkyl hydroperoxide reductase subunit AhpC [Iodobacter fluviatilis]STQ90195.1 Probable peroxiredoxin [Iodobacter fluviatilis]